MAAVDVLDLVRKNTRELVLAGAELDQGLGDKDAAAGYGAGVGSGVVNNQESVGYLLSASLRGQAVPKPGDGVGLVRAGQAGPGCESLVEQDLAGRGLDFGQHAAGDLDPRHHLFA